ncbi:hypothetical protein GSH08_08030 [Burkholderia pseudomallei]|nr:hypothetical protein F5D26_29560 [Burkholderia pseudomallei]MBM5577388.1 hypothetical protein [Burkholderia pseudomallei]MBM5583087.1 hypothetical protein [Burkholderia pseudomallei]RPA09426.1 hypothetical protein EGT86_18810 [Burkholderia pseudomallei]
MRVARRFGGRAPDVAGPVARPAPQAGHRALHVLSPSINY